MTAPWVKVCGLTRARDVAAAVDAGADAIGFVMVPSSPRALPARRVRALAADVPITTIVLTHDLPLAGLERVIDETGVDGVQPYGTGSGRIAAAAAATGYFVLVPGSPVAPDWLDEVPDGAYPLLDTPSPSRLGGTGRTFDWAEAAAIGRPFVLAGGLGPDNVASAVRSVRPWGVDASSRLEVEPGMKDAGRVAAFVAGAKSA